MNPAAERLFDVKHLNVQSKAFSRMLIWIIENLDNKNLISVLSQLGLYTNKNIKNLRTESSWANHVTKEVKGDEGKGQGDAHTEVLGQLPRGYPREEGKNNLPFISKTS